MYKTYKGRMGRFGTGGNPFDHGFAFFEMKPGASDLGMGDQILGEVMIDTKDNKLTFRHYDHKERKVDLMLECERIEHHVINHETKTEGFNGYGVSMNCAVLVTIEYDAKKPSCTIPGTYVTVTVAYNEALTL